MPQKGAEYYRELRGMVEKDHPFYNNTELAYEMILHEILYGGFEQNEKIPQESLAVLFDMSRTPVRDALLRLEQEKYLERTANGFQIKVMDLKDYVDFFEFRLILESKAAYFAARNISEEQLSLLERNLEQTKAEVKNGRLRNLAMLDNEFHGIIARASNNEYIRDTILQYQNKSVFNRQMVLETSNSRFVFNKHRDIYEAIEKSDEVCAEAAMRSHLQLYIKNLCSVYK